MHTNRIDRVFPALDRLQKQAAEYVAFLPQQAFERDYAKGRIITVDEGGEPVAYVWHGVIRPGRATTVYQAVVDTDIRRRYVGLALMTELIHAVQAKGGYAITLACASSNDAGNAFWQGIGFYPTAVKDGGIKRARDINLYRMDVQPTLFLPDSVPISTKRSDLTEYHRLKAQGVDMPSRFSRTHYGKRRKPDA